MRITAVTIDDAENTVQHVALLIIQVFFWSCVQNIEISSLPKKTVEGNMLHRISLGIKLNFTNTFLSHSWNILKADPLCPRLGLTDKIILFWNIQEWSLITISLYIINGYDAMEKLNFSKIQKIY